MRILKYDEKEELGKLLYKKMSSLDLVREKVINILKEVKDNGDKAVFEYTKKFDDYTPDSKNIQVSKKEIKEAYERVNKDLIKAIRKAKNNIQKYHEEQFYRTTKDWEMDSEIGILGEKVTPLENVGVYVPKGVSGYPSSVLMTVIPAKIAGVENISLVSPPPISPSILVAADICGVDKIYRIGGAQGIGALAHGTESVEQVDKIVGPGNVYVTVAKMLVFGRVDIDMPAGPSEVLIIADETANPKFIAADLLSQMEHDPDAQAILITDSGKIVNETGREIDSQMKDLYNIETIETSMNNSFIVIAKNMEECIEFAEKYAPEHLEIMTKDPEKIAKKVKHAGSIFLGDYSPVAAGDYASGTNHVLPTAGSARFSSPLSVRDFLKFSGTQKITKKGLEEISETVDEIASSEGFDAHAKSVKKRFD